jgi:ribonuclease R
MDKIILQEKKKILFDFISSKDYQPMKFKEMVGILQVPRNEKQDLREVLEALLVEGKITIDNAGKYKVSDGSTKTGTFSGTQRGFGFVMIEGEKDDIFIPENATKGALHGDTVMVTVKPDRTGKRLEGEVIQILERNNSIIVGTFEKSKNFGFVIADNLKFGKDIFIPKEYTKGAVMAIKL